MTTSRLTRAAGLLVGLAAIALFAVALPVRFIELATPCTISSAPAQVPAGGAPSGLLPQAYAAALVAIEGAFALLYLLVALGIFVRRAKHPMAFFVAWMLVMWGTTFPPTMLALPASDSTWFWPVAVARFLGAAAVTVFFYIFPDGRFRPRWAIGLAGIWVFSQVPKYFTPASTLNPDTWPPLLLAAVSAGFLAVMVALQVYRYRWVSNAAERRQTKWVVLGIAAALTGYAALLVLRALQPALAQPGTLSSIAIVAGEDACVALLPLAVGVAILRDRLYDVDVLINRTLVYGSLTATLAVVYIGLVIVLQQVVRLIAGEAHGQDPIVTVVSTLAIAALFQPLRRRLQHGIDRRFFRRRYNAAATLAGFGQTLRTEVDVDRLTKELLSAVVRTMEPDGASLWLSPVQPSQLPEHRKRWDDYPVAVKIPDRNEAFQDIGEP